jgi:hypothetical protein
MSYRASLKIKSNSHLYDNDIAYVAAFLSRPIDMMYHPDWPSITNGPIVKIVLQILDPSQWEKKDDEKVNSVNASRCLPDAVDVGNIGHRMMCIFEG